jgi:hypothetical protein
MNTDLIEKLKALNPTEGEWDNTQYGSIYSGQIHIADVSNGDDCELFPLAPEMRKALLEMEEEMKRLKQQLATEKRFRFEDAASALDQINDWRDRALKAERLTELSSSEKGLCRICGGDNCDSDSHK